MGLYLKICHFDYLYWLCMRLQNWFGTVSTDLTIFATLHQFDLSNVWSLLIPEINLLENPGFFSVTGIDIWLAVFSITLIAVLYTLLVSWYSAHLICKICICCKHKRYYHRAVKRPAALYMVDPFLTNYHSFTIVVGAIIFKWTQ